MATAPKDSKPQGQAYLALFVNFSFMLLWLGQMLTYLGDRLYQMTLLDLVPPNEGFNRDEIMTYMGFFSLLPYILFAPWAGPAADRYSRKGILVFTTLPLGLLVVAVALTGLTPFVLHHLAMLIYILTFMVGAFTIFFFTAKQALIPQIVGNSELMAANSLSSFAGTVMVLIGTFAFVGLTHARTPLTWMLYIGAATYIVSGIMFSCIVVPEGKKLPPPTAVESFRRKIREGLRYVRGHRRVLKLITLSFMVMFLSGLLFAVINGTVLGKNGLNWPVLDYALTTGVLGIGMVTGAVITTFVQRKIRSFELFVAGCLTVTCVAMLAFINLQHADLAALPRPVVLWKRLAPPIMIMGMCGGALVVFVVTLLQRTVPRRFHGRVFALNSMCDTAGLLLAMGGAGLLLGRGWQKAVIITGCVASVVAIVGSLLSSRSMRRRIVRQIARLTSGRQ